MTPHREAPWRQYWEAPHTVTPQAGERTTQMQRAHLAEGSRRIKRCQNVSPFHLASPPPFSFSSLLLLPSSHFFSLPGRSFDSYCCRKKLASIVRELPLNSRRNSPHLICKHASSFPTYFFTFSPTPPPPSPFDSPPPHPCFLHVKTSLAILFSSTVRCGSEQNPWIECAATR